jgi:hypothetical protein
MEARRWVSLLAYLSVQSNQIESNPFCYFVITEDQGRFLSVDSVPHFMLLYVSRFPPFVHIFEP